MKTATLITLVMLLAMATPARAGSTMGCLGVDDFASFAVVGGATSLEATGYDAEASSEVPFQRDGGLFTGRLHICAIEKQTMFGSFMGWDGKLDLGYFTHSGPGDAPEGEEEADEEGFYINFALGMNASILNWGGDRHPSGRLAVLLGLGLDIDFAYAYAGFRLGATIVDEALGLELEYTYVPVGRSWDGPYVTEHRPTLSLVIEISKEFRLGIGAEARFGHHKDRDGYAPLDQDFVGDYYIISGVLSFRIRD